MMHLEQMSPLRRRMIALLILLLPLITMVALVAWPYRSVVANYDIKVVRLNEKLAHYHAIMQDGDKAREQQHALERIESANGFFLASNEPALASAELQRRIKQVIEQSGGTVVSSQMMGEKSRQGLEQVLLRVQMRSDLDAMQKVFHSVETQSPILMLDNVLIGARATGNVTPGKGASPRQLDVRFDVAGFRHALGGPTAVE